jgi:hypothetical protein
MGACRIRLQEGVVDDRGQRLPIRERGCGKPGGVEGAVVEFKI